MSSESSTASIARRFEGLDAQTLAEVGKVPAAERANVVPYSSLLELLRRAEFYVTYPSISLTAPPQQREELGRVIREALAVMGAEPFYPLNAAAPAEVEPPSRPVYPFGGPEE